MFAAIRRRGLRRLSVNVLFVLQLAVVGSVARAGAVDTRGIGQNSARPAPLRIAQSAVPGAAIPSQEDLDRQAAEIERAEADKAEQIAEQKRLEEAERTAAAAAEEQRALDEKERRDAVLRATDVEKQKELEAEIAGQIRSKRREHLASYRVTGYVLGGGGLALAATGLLSYRAAQSKEQSIETGGFATGNDISTAASQVRLYQGVSGTLWTVGGAALVTGIIVVLSNGDDSSETALSNKTSHWAWIMSGLRW